MMSLWPSSRRCWRRQLDPLRDGANLKFKTAPQAIPAEPFFLGEKDKYMGQIQILTKIIGKEMEKKKEAERD